MGISRCDAQRSARARAIQVPVVVLENLQPREARESRRAESGAVVIIVGLILLLCIAGVSLNLHAAHQLETRPTFPRLPAPTGDDSIPSIADHPARVIPCEPDDVCSPDQGWMQTYSGRKFYPLHPRAEDVELADVAHGLAMTCRYGGHSRLFYSVAEHCVLVSE